MPMLIPLGIMAGGSIAGALSNKKSARTGESTSTNNSTTTTNRNLLPFQEGLMDPLSSFSLDLIRNPSAAVDPIRRAGAQRINQGYAGAPQAIADKSLAFGGSRSGKFGKSMRQSELARQGAQGDFEGSIAGMIMNQQMQGASLAERLLGQSFGTTANTNGTSSGTQVNPGSAVGGGIAGGLDALTTLLMLNSMSGGRSGGGGAGANPTLGNW